jgi:Cation efflux family
MAHYRKPLAAAAALNTAIFVVEAVAGFQADSLSLVMDSVHNLSDEMALVFLYLAFVLPHGISRHLLRSANLFNSVGLVLVSGLLLWQAVERILHPAPVVGSVAIVIGLLAAANWGVARLLLAPSRNNAAIRLAYIHNIGDVYLSLAPFDFRSPHRGRHRRVDHRFHRAGGFYIERGAHLARENRLRPFRPRGGPDHRHSLSAIEAIPQWEPVWTREVSARRDPLRP